MTKWEYFFQRYYSKPTHDEVQGHFDNLGAKGWELVCLTAAGDYIFKRRVVELQISLEQLEDINKAPPQQPIAIVESVPIYSPETDLSQIRHPAEHAKSFAPKKKR